MTLTTACDQHDIGQPCPQLLAGQSADGETLGPRAESQEVVEQNLAFPCEELICVATVGSDGYCSRKCREDAGCPQGFECRNVQPVGAFADQKFCTWKTCDSVGACGSADEFCCRSIEGGSPNNADKTCAFVDSGVCS